MTYIDMIPRIIHYCWFGGKKKPKLVRDCILSWKKKLHGYEFIEWNENNADLSHPFVREAYRMKKWAFVADFIRFKSLFEMGGIYLDTDMMLLKPLDIFLNNHCFFGAEEKNIVSCGIIGSVKNNIFIKDCLSIYDFIDLKKDIKWEEYVITQMVTDLFKFNYGFRQIFNIKLVFNDIIIYPTQVFYPFPYSRKDDLINYKKYLYNESYAVHLWVGSWVEHNEFSFLSQGKYIKGIKILFNQFSMDKFNIKYLRDVLSAIKQSIVK